MNNGPARAVSISHGTRRALLGVREALCYGWRGFGSDLRRRAHCSMAERLCPERVSE